MADDVMEHYWLQVIAGKLDRLIELGENVERASRSQEMPEEWGEHEGDHFAGANKMVAEGPSTEAVRSDSLGDGYRIPSEGDIGKVVEVRHAMGESWVQRKLVKVLSDSVPGCAALRHCQFLCPLDQSQTMATCWRWARIKIDEPAKEPPKPPKPPEPPEPEYREPVLPADAGKVCEFSSDGNDWTEAKLQGYAGCFWISVSSEAAAPKIWDHARIKKES